MNTIKVRKNFIFDKDVIDKAQRIISAEHKNLTEALTTYLKAIVKEPSILKTIERSANKRTGSFIGMLDGEIGDDQYKDMKKEAFSKADI